MKTKIYTLTNTIDEYFTAKIIVTEKQAKTIIKTLERSAKIAGGDDIAAPDEVITFKKENVTRDDGIIITKYIFEDMASSCTVLEKISTPEGYHFSDEFVKSFEKEFISY